MVAASETRKVLGDYRLLGYRIGKHTPDTVDTVRERVALPDNTQTLAVQRLWGTTANALHRHTKFGQLYSRHLF